MSNSDSLVLNLDPAIAASVRPGPERAVYNHREYIRHPGIRAPQDPSVIWNLGEEYERNHKRFWRCGIFLQGLIQQQPNTPAEDSEDCELEDEDDCGINGAGGVAEKKRSFVFYTPISIYNLLILDSWSSLFHNYRIWLWAYPGPWAIHGLGRLFWLAHESPGPSTTGGKYEFTQV